MLSLPSYKRDWETKKKWYAKHFPDALLVTEESPKLSNLAAALIKKHFV